MRQNKHQSEFYDGLEKVQDFAVAFPLTGLRLALVSMLNWMLSVSFFSATFVLGMTLIRKLQLSENFVILLFIATIGVMPFLVMLWAQSFFATSLSIDHRNIHLTYKTKVGFARKSIPAEPIRFALRTRNIVFVVTRRGSVTGMPRFWHLIDSNRGSSVFEVSTRGVRLVLKKLTSDSQQKLEHKSK